MQQIKKKSAFHSTRCFLLNSEKPFLSYSLAKEFGLATEEFCQLAKELYSAGKASGRVAKKFCRLGKEFESVKLLCDRLGKEFGQAELLFCRLQLFSGRAKLLGQRALFLLTYAGYQMQKKFLVPLGSTDVSGCAANAGEADLACEPAHLKQNFCVQMLLADDAARANLAFR